MSGFLDWLQASSLGQAMRESGPWTYAIVNVVHILGIAALAGAVLILDLRLLGVWRRTPLSALADAASPVAAVAFAAAAASGICLLASNATDYLGNPFLLIKFVAIPAGLVNAVALRASTAWRARAVREPSTVERRRLAVMGAISLVSWLTAIVAGRMIAYW